MHCNVYPIFVKFVRLTHSNKELLTYLVAQIVQLFEPSTVLWAFHAIQPSSSVSVDSVVLWYHDVVISRFHAFVVSWFCDSMVLWFYDSVVCAFVVPLGKDVRGKQRVILFNRVRCCLLSSQACFSGCRHRRWELWAVTSTPWACLVPKVVVWCHQDVFRPAAWDLIDWLSEGFTSHPTQIRSFRRRSFIRQ